MSLFTFTLAVNYTALIIAWWFGLYVVTRSPRRLISWLTGLTFWAMAGLFLNILFALSPPPAPQYFPNWLQYFFLIWPKGTLEGSSSTWLQGWSITLSVMTWHHVTVLMRPGGFSKWRAFRVVLGYLIAAIVIVVQLTKTHLIYTSTSGDPLYLSTLKPGPLYPVIAASILTYSGMGIFNLLHSVRAASNTIHRKQYKTLGIATLIAGFSAPISIMGSTLSIGFPMVILSVIYMVAIAMIGYSVARHSALLEDRTIQRDLRYNAATMVVIVSLYVLGTWGYINIYDAPVAAIIPIIVLAITTHMVVDAARLRFDLNIQLRSNREIRAIIGQLTGVSSEKNKTEIICSALASMSATVRATYSLVLFFDGDQVNKLASHDWTLKLPQLNPSALSSDDVLQLDPGHFSGSLQDAALLIPLYADAIQIGAILLGRPKNGLIYPQTDIELLLYLSDKLAEVIQAQKQERYLIKLVKATARNSAKIESDCDQISVKDVENALRKLTDYAYLGDTNIASLKQVKLRLSADEITHLDKGKAAYSIIREAIEKLRPAEGKVPSYPIPREWHAYLVLHDAYVGDKPNRDIMSQLYISEGTFNRTRRAAIRSIARVLGEMETALH